MTDEPILTDCLCLQATSVVGMPYKLVLETIKAQGRPVALQFVGPEWKTGDVIDIDTEDGLEKGVTLLGPAKSGDLKQMSVRFADGSVDDWDTEDFVMPVTSKFTSNRPLLVISSLF